MNKQKILILAPHTDDGEFGCGGAIVKFTKEGCDVYYAAFSACQQSVLPDFPSDILISEVKEATKILGIKPENLILFDYEVRTFGYRRQEILDDLIRLRDSIKPDIIFISYELPWNNFSFTTSCFVHLDDECIQVKVNALKAYRSQAHRPYSDEDFIRSLARTRGVQIGTKYAEAFEVVRWII